VTSEELSRAFSGPVEPVPLGMRFRLGLLVVAIATVLLPLIYVGIAAGAGWLVYKHIVNNIWILTEGRSGTVGRVLLYGGPAVIGTILVFFMWKPLLARAPKSPPPVVVTGKDAPLLVAFIERIRQLVGAPAPREIRLDTWVNASAGFRRGMWSLFSRDDLVLTIGTPLLSGMTSRQLAGVLAHELGHFAQGSSMRLTYLIRSVNMWLARVAYERDSWDLWLARTAESTDLRIGIVLHIARFVVWLTRKVLAGLATAGHAIGTFMLREMEYDADRYEARLAGSDVFASTALRLRVLSVARGRAIAVSSIAWRDGRLCDDLGGLIAGVADRMPPELRKQIETVDPEKEKGGTFDTHPPDHARIESAQRQRAPGVFQLEAPAGELLPADGELLRRVTVAFYQHENDLHPSAAQLISVSDVLARQDTLEAEEGAAERYFGEVFDLFNPLGGRGEATPAIGGLGAGLASLAHARETALRLRPEPLPEDAPPTLKRDPEKVAAAQQAARQRLAAAVALLHQPDVRQRLDRAEQLEAEVNRLSSALASLSLEAPALQQLATAHDELVDLFNQLSSAGEDESLNSRIMEGLGRLHVQTGELERRLEAVPYPFEHARGTVTMATYAFQDLPADDGMSGETQARTATVLRRMLALETRARGRLAVIAERLEKVGDELAAPA
jgi:Zn-dependent protease with chaperone function